MWDAIKDRVLENRSKPTPAEELLWRELRKLKSKGLHFRRQHAIGHFIVDFYCWKARLAVEVDGPIHQDQATADEARSRYLESRGVRIIRFRNDEVTSSINQVVARILAHQ